MAPPLRQRGKHTLSAGKVSSWCTGEVVLPVHHVGKTLICASWSVLAAGLVSPPAAGMPSWHGPWLYGNGVLNSTGFVLSTIQTILYQCGASGGRRGHARAPPMERARGPRRPSPSVNTLKLRTPELVLLLYTTVELLERREFSQGFGLLVPYRSRRRDSEVEKVARHA